MIFRLLASPAYYAVQLFLPVKSLKMGLRLGVVRGQPFEKWGMKLGI